MRARRYARAALRGAHSATHARPIAYRPAQDTFWQLMQSGHTHTHPRCLTTCLVDALACRRTSFPSARPTRGASRASLLHAAIPKVLPRFPFGEHRGTAYRLDVLWVVWRDPHRMRRLEGHRACLFGPITLVVPTRPRPGPTQMTNYLFGGPEVACVPASLLQHPRCAGEQLYYEDLVPPLINHLEEAVQPTRGWCRHCKDYREDNEAQLDDRVGPKMDDAPVKESRISVRE